VSYTDFGVSVHGRCSSIANVKFMPVVWSALWRNRAESVLTLLALSVAFALFSVMIAINAAYEQAIDDTRIDRLIVTCAFDCGTIPLGYREQLARIGGVRAVGGELWVGGGKDQNEHHLTTVTFMDEGIRSAWPELPMTRADWRALDMSPTGIFLTRTAAARRNARIGDTMTMNAGPGSGTDGSGTWFFTVLGFIPDPTGWGQQWSPDMIIGNLRYFQNSGR